MANNNTTQPVAKPPQTAGMRASAGLAGAGGNIKSYMDARGAKPAASTGTYNGAGPKPPQQGGGKPKGYGDMKPPTPGGANAGSYGNLAKQRRMQGAPISAANRTARNIKNGGNVGGPKPPTFQPQNGVPTGGRGQDGQMGQLAQRMGAGGGARGAVGRAQAFLHQRQQGGGQTPPTRGGGQLSGIASQLGGSTAGPKNPNGPLASARNAMSQLKKPGHSTHPQPGTAVMPNVKPPQGGKPGVAQTMTPPSARPPLLGGPKPPGHAGGGGTIGPGRQRPKVV